MPWWSSRGCCSLPPSTLPFPTFPIGPLPSSPYPGRRNRAHTGRCSVLLTTVSLRFSCWGWVVGWWRLPGAPLQPAGLRNCRNGMKALVGAQETFLVEWPSAWSFPGSLVGGRVREETLIRAPDVSSLLSLIMNFSSGLVGAGPFLRLGDCLGGVPWRPSPRCIRNHGGKESQKKPESPPTGSQP